VRRDKNDIKDNLDDDKEDENGGGGGIWDLLPTWTEGLRNVATLVVSLLGIPQNLRCTMASVVVGMTMIDIDVVDVPMYQT
jgi:hypothetical protein